MFNELEEDHFKLSDSLEAFNELEKCTDRAILSQRANERIEVRAKVLIRPANPSQQHQNCIESVTADISSSGCMLLAPRAILPGDLFHLTFFDSLRRINPQFARCLRCRMIQEDAYEIGIRFLQNVPLRESLT